MPFNCFVVGDTNLYNTIHDHELLESLWNKYGPEASPLRCTCCRTKVYWREGSSRPHVYHPARDSKCPLHRAKGNTEQHERIQWALVRLGRSLGEQEPRLEFPEADGRCRFDVVWPEAGIAWEVDLTINTAREQLRRREVRAKSKYRMISIRDAKWFRPSRSLEVPTIGVNNLSNADTPEGFRLSQAYVYGVYEPSQQLGAATWRCRRSLDFKTFAEETTRKAIVYRQHPSLPKGYGWVRETDLRQAEEHKKRRRLLLSERMKLSEKQQILQSKKRAVDDDIKALKAALALLQRVVRGAAFREVQEVRRDLEPIWRRSAGKSGLSKQIASLGLSEVPSGRIRFGVWRLTGGLGVFAAKCGSGAQELDKLIEDDNRQIQTLVAKVEELTGEMKALDAELRRRPASSARGDIPSYLQRPRRERRPR